MNDNTTDAAPVEAATVEADTAPAEGATDVQADAPTEDDPGDVFPREVVEKLRRESASYRDRAKTAEDRLSAMQRQSVARQITAAGMRPEAVWAVAGLDDLLADDGTVDADRVKTAMANARTTLGIQQRPAPRPGQGELNSGAGVSQARPAGWVSAFGRREK